jgi:hypothetical protein
LISPKFVFNSNTQLNSSIIDAVWLIREINNDNETKMKITKELDKTYIKYKVFDRNILAKRSLKKMSRDISNRKSIINSTNLASKYYSVDEVILI